MKKNMDKVSQAYYFELGKEFGNKVRKRIHWILENSTGESILDVGCSQGLVSIMLAREGKDVIGIDVLKEAIDYAKDKLENEEDSTKRHLQFINENFIDYDFDKKFDVIIMGEVLEHISDAGRFINRAVSLLENHGKLIVTVPFGVNDYFDHKHTYYLSSLIKFTNFGLSIDKVNFMGKWVGIVFTKSEESKQGIKNISLELLADLEYAFETVERENITKILQLSNELKEAEKKDDLEPKYNEVNIELLKLEEKLEKSKEELESEKMQHLTLKRKLYEQQEKEQRLLKELKNTQLRYASLKNSRLGKLTRRYWKWKSGRR